MTATEKWRTVHGQRYFPQHGHTVVGAFTTWYEMTGEYRAPRKGEMYLSGAIPEAYEAYNDLDTAYHVLRRVEDPPSRIVKNGWVYRLAGPATTTRGG